MSIKCQQADEYGVQSTEYRHLITNPTLNAKCPQRGFAGAKVQHFFELCKYYTRIVIFFVITCSRGHVITKEGRGSADAASRRRKSAGGRGADEDGERARRLPAGTIDEKRALGKHAHKTPPKSQNVGGKGEGNHRR